MSLTGKTVSASYKDILQVDNSNSGVSTSLKAVKDGQGNLSSLYISDDNVKIIPENDDTTTLLDVQDKDGNTKLVVDTTNDYVKALGHQVNTQFKEFGLFDFSPTAGYHNPMICNNMMFSDSGSDFIQDISMFSNGADPATTLDLSANGTPMTAIACYWYVPNDLTIDEARVLATADGSVNLNFHIYSYTLDTSSDHGDLSSGTLLAHIGSVLAATSSTVKTSTLTIDSANVDANKIIIAFVENETDTTDISAQLIIKYHLR